MRDWLILVGLVILVIVLPVIALTNYFGSLGRLIGQIVLSIVLILAIIGSGLFGYIFFKAQAKKWGVGLFLAAVLCIIITYWLWAGRLPFF